MTGLTIGICCVLCLLSWNAYGLYRLPDDGTNRKWPLFAIIGMFILLFGSALGCIIWRAL